MQANLSEALPVQANLSEALSIEIANIFNIDFKVNLEELENPSSRYLQISGTLNGTTLLPAGKVRSDDPVGIRLWLIKAVAEYLIQFGKH